MKEQAATPSYKRHRFPPAIIGHVVWLYFRFALGCVRIETAGLAALAFVW